MKRHGFLIANDTFPDYPGLPSLKTPQNDIKALGDVLKDSSRGQFEPIYYLPNRRRDEVYTLISTALDRAETTDLILIYFSGHGILDDEGDLHLAFPEITESLITGTIPFSWIAKAVEKSQSRRVVIILDCCYSGAAGKAFEQRGFTPSPELVRQVIERGGFAPHNAVELRGLAPDSVEDVTQDQQGRYLLTACSPAQTAIGNVSSGYGVFTSHLIQALSSKAAFNYPGEENRLKSLITVGSVYRYVADKLRDSTPLQTPMMWSKDVVGGDLTIAVVLLAGSKQAATDPAQRWKLVKTKGALALNHLGPAYLLDDAFKFLDWNAAFDELVARELGLLRGSHVSTLIASLVNFPGVKERSRDEFIPHLSIPAVHLEPLEFNSRRFGRIRFRKIATQICDSGGQVVAWCVNLNVSDADHFEELWIVVEDAMKRQATWSRYARSYDEIVGKWSKYIELRNALCDMLDHSSASLDLGAGTGNCTVRLLETSEQRSVTAIEGNEEMLACLDSKIEKRKGFKSRISLIKGDVVSCLREQKGEIFDGCIMLNVLYAVDDPPACLGEVFRVMTPGAILALSTSHEATDVTELFASIDSELEPDNSKQKALWNDALERNKEMLPLIVRYSSAATKNAIEEAGFRILEWREDFYMGNVIVAKCLKP